MMMRQLPLAAAVAVLAIAGIDAAAAQDRGYGRGYARGPVATMCAPDIAAYCRGYSHGNRGVRSCLERRWSRLSSPCKAALDNTGGGRGMGRFYR